MADISEDVEPSEGLGVFAVAKRIVCAACLGGRWAQSSIDADWACLDCGHHNALVIDDEGLAKIRAKRKEKIE